MQNFITKTNRMQSTIINDVYNNIGGYLSDVFTYGGREMYGILLENICITITNPKIRWYKNCTLKTGKRIHFKFGFVKLKYGIYPRSKSSAGITSYHYVYIFIT